MKKFIFIYFWFLVFSLSFFASGFVDSQDGFQYLAVARRMYYDHTFEMPPEKFSEKDANPVNIHMSYAPGKDGKMYSPTGLGYSVALLPAVIFEDFFLKKAGVEPISAFPLKSDWPVLFLASITNAFFGALLGIVMYLYLRSFKLSHKVSLLLSFLTIFATNIFPFAKHVYPHMMFVSFLTLTFYLFRRYSQDKNRFHLVGAGVTFGIVILSYNPTFLLSVLPLSIYYLLLNKLGFSLHTIKKMARDALLFLAGAIPFYAIYTWFNIMRFGEASSGYSGGILTTLTIERPVNVIFEGIWGVLFSPGRSFFLYTPILILIFLFWFKLRKNLLPEIISYSVLFVIYVGFMGTLMGGADYPVWHGEANWGPRYMLPVIPFGMILIANIYISLTRKAKLFIFVPLVLTGFWFQIIGVLLPYQIKFAGLQIDNFLNGRNFNIYEYGNEIPRYSPILKMSSTLIKRLKNLTSLKHGQYNLKLYDGFDLPFDLGWTTWRGTHSLANISFDNSKEKPINSITIQFRNHQIDKKSQYPVRITSYLGNNEENSSNVIIPAGEEKELTVKIANLMDKENKITLESEFIGTSSAELKGIQPIFLQIFRINGTAQNIKSIDFPYVSPVSEKLYNAVYEYWGKRQTDPWEIWYMHSGVYEQTFDLWWMRPYHYWDLPKKFFAALFLLNVFGIVYPGIRLLRMKNE